MSQNYPTHKGCSVSIPWSALSDTERTLHFLNSNRFTDQESFLAMYNSIQSPDFNELSNRDVQDVFIQADPENAEITFAEGHTLIHCGSLIVSLANAIKKAVPQITPKEIIRRCSFVKYGWLLWNSISNIDKRVKFKQRYRSVDVLQAALKERTSEIFIFETDRQIEENRNFWVLEFDNEITPEGTLRVINSVTGKIELLSTNNLKGGASIEIMEAA